MKRCFICGSRSTTISKTPKGTPYEHWYNRKGGFLCMKCYKKEYIKNNPDKVKEWNIKSIAKWGPRHLTWTPEGKIIHLNENPRKGICLNCGKIGLTHIHHIKYHKEDPLKDTVELCQSCHMKIHHPKGMKIGANM